MYLLSLFDFIARFHPVLVHLPIGILLLACFFQWLLIKDRFAVLEPAVPVALFWGMVSAVASCVSGYFLSQSGDYDEQLVGRHQWLGISVAIVSLVLWLLYQLSISESIARWISLVLVLLIVFTGHLGGSLTHGSGYLTEGLNAVADSKGPAIKPIPNIQEAILYKDAIQPLLQARCYNCHGPNKKKGKLRLDTPEFIWKGGEDGKVIDTAKVDESELIKRLLLPSTDEDHMPPKEKPQLTKTEIDLLHWWVSTGADVSKKVKDLPQNEKIKGMLAILQTGEQAADVKQPADIPAKTVAAAEEKAINALKDAGVMLVPVAQNSNYLSANFVTVTLNADSVIKLLEPIQKQLVWLNLGYSAVSDAGLVSVAKLDNLTRLFLNNTAVTDKGIAALSKSASLRYINLVNTKITLAGLSQLKDLKQLQSIYLYKTTISKDQWGDLKKMFPKVVLDSGGYVVPVLATDTTEVKE
ncbi:MAG: hypothetical protein JNL23_09015 [Chitinophagaceae bacterium]|nr:hypothetical protein [Chitinophagaceae bacterium]